MKIKRPLCLLGLSLAAVLSLTACGPSTDPKKDGIFDVSSIVDDLTFDDNGDPVFYDEVKINLYSVITLPDLTTFEQVVNEFNKQYSGSIKVELESVNESTYYSQLEQTFDYDREHLPDMCLMHNEKIIHYTHNNYFYRLDKLAEMSHVETDFSEAYEDIDRVNFYQDVRFGFPIDAHGFLNYIRQDIVKKNGLGWDTDSDGVQDRFVPVTRAEYKEFLQKAREKADAGELQVRQLGKISTAADENKHAWHTLSKTEAKEFFPVFTYGTDPIALAALYSNGGRLSNEAQDTVTFGESEGLKQLLKDYVNDFNKKYVGEGTISNVEGYASGNYLMFSEGPWWASMQYDPDWNIKEMGQETKQISPTVTVSTGISAEDAADPVMNKPFSAVNYANWFALDNAPADTAHKWYGNGHCFGIMKSCKSLTKVAACLIFANWLTQGQNAKGEFNLVKHCTSGHVPAWKNVYASSAYKAAVEENVTLQGIGDPANIMAMEGLKYEPVLFYGIQNVLGNLRTDLLNSYTGGAKVTEENALSILAQVITATQSQLDLVISEEM